MWIITNSNILPNNLIIKKKKKKLPLDSVPEARVELYRNLKSRNKTTPIWKTQTILAPNPQPESSNIQELKHK